MGKARPEQIAVRKTKPLWQKPHPRLELSPQARIGRQGRERVGGELCARSLVSLRKWRDSTDEHLHDEPPGVPGRGGRSEIKNFPSVLPAAGATMCGACGPPR